MAGIERLGERAWQRIKFGKLEVKFVGRTLNVKFGCFNTNLPL